MTTMDELGLCRLIILLALKVSFLSSFHLRHEAVEVNYLGILGFDERSLRLLR